MSVTTPDGVPDSETHLSHDLTINAVGEISLKMLCYQCSIWICVIKIRYRQNYLIFVMGIHIIPMPSTLKDCSKYGTLVFSQYCTKW